MWMTGSRFARSRACLRVGSKVLQPLCWTSVETCHQLFWVTIMLNCLTTKLSRECWCLSLSEKSLLKFKISNKTVETAHTLAAVPSIWKMGHKCKDLDSLGTSLSLTRGTNFVPVSNWPGQRSHSDASQHIASITCGNHINSSPFEAEAHSMEVLGWTCYELSCLSWRKQCWLQDSQV